MWRMQVNQDLEEILRDVFGDKRDAERVRVVGRVRDAMTDAISGIHPAHRARAYREVERLAGDAAERQEETDLENGVPE